MATQDTIDAVRAFIAAFNARDVEALVSLCHDRVLYALDDNFPTHTPEFVRSAFEATIKRAGPQAYYAYSTHNDEPVAVLWAPDKKTKGPEILRVTNFNAYRGKIRLIADSTQPAKLARVTCAPPEELLAAASAAPSKEQKSDA